MIEGVFENQNWLTTILDAIPLPVFVVDADVRTMAFNREASRLLGPKPELLLRRRSGEILHCIHSVETPEGCGGSGACRDCAIRNSVADSFQNGRVLREKTMVDLTGGEDGDRPKKVRMLVTTSPFVYNNERMVLLILQDITALTMWGRMLPVCAHCRKIRDDDTHWVGVEQYLKKHLDLDFTHGVCPECMEHFYAECSGLSPKDKT